MNSVEIEEAVSSLALEKFGRNRRVTLASAASILNLADALSEPEALRAVDVLTFEKSYELVPATSADLQRVGVARLSDIAHQLLHGDLLPLHPRAVRDYLRGAGRLGEVRSPQHSCHPRPSGSAPIPDSPESGLGATT